MGRPLTTHEQHAAALTRLITAMKAGHEALGYELELEWGPRIEMWLTEGEEILRGVKQAVKESK